MENWIMKSWQNRSLNPKASQHKQHFLANLVHQGSNTRKKIKVFDRIIQIPVEKFRLRYWRTKSSGRFGETWVWNSRLVHSVKVSACLYNCSSDAGKRLIAFRIQYSSKCRNFSKAALVQEFKTVTKTNRGFDCSDLSILGAVWPPRSIESLT